MELNQLLEVQDTFQVKEGCLIIEPRLTPLVHRGFRACCQHVWGVHPDGTTRELEGQFVIAHYHQVHGPGKWEVELTLLDASTVDVPVGSRVLVDEATFAVLTQGPPGN